MELDEFRRILDDCAAAHWSSRISDARMFLVTSSEDVPPLLQELLDPWVITEAQAFAAEGWSHIIFAVFKGYPPCEWTVLPPERVTNCANADDAHTLCERVLDQLAERVVA